MYYLFFLWLQHIRFRDRLATGHKLVLSQRSAVACTWVSRGPWPHWPRAWPRQIGLTQIWVRLFRTGQEGQDTTDWNGTVLWQRLPHLTSCFSFPPSDKTCPNLRSQWPSRSQASDSWALSCNFHPSILDSRVNLRFSYQPKEYCASGSIALFFLFKSQSGAWKAKHLDWSYAVRVR